MYTFETRIRYSECGGREQVRLSSILDYLQDVCTFEAEDLGVGVDYMNRHQTAWILNSWQVDIQRYPVLGEKIRVSTWPYDWHGFFGFRNFTIQDGTDVLILRANSVWVFMDMNKGRPVKIAPENTAAYQLGGRLDMEYLDRKLPDFEAEAAGSAFRVPRCFIDTNRHMNNAKYIQLAGELFPPDFQAARVRVEYRRAAVYGDTLYPYAAAGPGRLSVKLSDQEQKPYAIMEFYDKILKY